MTVSSTTRKSGPYTGNGVTVAFPFDFKVFEKTDVRVVFTQNAVDSPLSLDSDYSVTLNADQNSNPGGTILYPISGTPLTNLQMLTIAGALAELQPTDLTNLGGFFPETIEDALDRAVILIQQQGETLSRTLQFALSDTASGTQLPAQARRAGKAFIFDENGNVAVSVDDYNDQAENAASSAAAAAASQVAAANSQAAAATSETNAASSAAQALYYAQHGTGFTAGTFYDLGSVADPLTLFPTDLGSVP